MKNGSTGWVRKKKDDLNKKKKRYFYHFHKMSFGIKILYGGTRGRGYGGRGRIRHENIRRVQLP